MVSRRIFAEQKDVRTYSATRISIAKVSKLDFGTEVGPLVLEPCEKSERLLLKLVCHGRGGVERDSRRIGDGTAKRQPLRENGSLVGVTIYH